MKRSNFGFKITFIRSRTGTRTGTGTGTWISTWACLNSCGQNEGNATLLRKSCTKKFARALSLRKFNTQQQSCQEWFHFVSLCDVKQKNHPSDISTETRWAFSINVKLTFEWKLGGVSPGARSSRSLGPSWWSCWGRGFFYLCGDVRWCIRHYILFHNTARRNKTTHQQTDWSILDFQV